MRAWAQKNDKNALPLCGLATIRRSACHTTNISNSAAPSRAFQVKSGSRTATPQEYTRQTTCRLQGRTEIENDRTRQLTSFKRTRSLNEEIERMLHPIILVGGRTDRHDCRCSLGKEERHDCYRVCYRKHLHWSNRLTHETITIVRKKGSRNHTLRHV